MNIVNPIWIDKRRPVISTLLIILVAVEAYFYSEYPDKFLAYALLLISAIIIISYIFFYKPLSVVESGIFIEPKKALFTRVLVKWESIKECRIDRASSDIFILPTVPFTLEIVDEKTSEFKQDFYDKNGLMSVLLKYLDKSKLKDQTLS